MTNHSKLEFKPNVGLGTPIAVILDAADWLVFMSWAQTKNTDGASTIINGRISMQVLEAVMTPASIKAAEADLHERAAAEMNPFQQVIDHITGQRSAANVSLEDFADASSVDTVWIIRCVLCGSESEYAPHYNNELICGHNGMRQLLEIRLRGGHEVDDD